MDEAHVRALRGGPAGWWQYMEQVHMADANQFLLPNVKVDVAGAEFLDHDFSAFSIDYPGSDAGPNGVAGLALGGANFSGCDLRGCNFAGASLMFTDFRNARLDGASFENALLGNTRFEGASLVGAIFRGVSSGAILTGADVTDADFSDYEFDTEVAPVERYPMLDGDRKRFIENITYGDWVDSSQSDEEFERLVREWEAKTETFVTTETDVWQLHAFVDMYNWDVGLGLLRKVLDNPACDRGVALEVFWRAQPTYYQAKDESSLENWERETYEFVIELRDRLAGERYPEVLTTFDTVWSEPDADGARWTIPDEWRNPGS